MKTAAKEQDGNNAGATLTKSELNRFEDAFAKKEFRDLMAEYMKEISDPKHRKEQEEYLRQLEAQNDIPEGKQILHPNPGYVIKFKTMITNNDDGKLFINIVYSEDIKKPQSKEVPSKKGREWFLPYSLGPLRMERDNHDDPVPTFDCCFHPETLIYGWRSVSFRDLIASTAREAASLYYTKQMELKSEGFHILPNYRILKGVKYKTGNPSVMVVGMESTGSSDTTFKASNTEAQNDEPKTNMTTNGVVRSSKSKAGERKGINSGFLLSDEIKSGGEKAAYGDKAPKKSLKCQPTVVEPSYEVVERDDFDLADHTIDGPKCSSIRPKYLEYRIMLPHISSSQQVSLDVSNDKLQLESLKDSPPNYKLSIRLPYQVECEEGSARFDKATRILRVILHVSRSDPMLQNHCQIRAIDDTMSEQQPAKDTQKHQ